MIIKQVVDDIGTNVHTKYLCTKWVPRMLTDLHRHKQTNVIQI